MRSIKCNRMLGPLWEGAPAAAGGGESISPRLSHSVSFADTSLAEGGFKEYEVHD